MNSCKNCSKESENTFCSKNCISSYGGKQNKIHYKEIECPCCKTMFTPKRSRQKFCSAGCSRKGKWTDETRKKQSLIKKELMEEPEQKNRLRDIGRKGGFGKKGYTEKGTRYDSLFEKEFFEYLEKENINFIPHKNIPNSSKISDAYLVDTDTWIELDGIDRESKKDWIGKNYDNWIEKLKIYKEQNLNLIVIKKGDNYSSMV